ncbi:DNA-binding response regulator, NarL/FixJ family, contains REC and HTH domains [Parafrankia irregularis]|uniref:DNA-binding response regulator, NarL/FixJ family, contains REC and HTH domains n=1 Tax=Parafrankia irregularis TaxID=795642 RepID=A0A0S4QG61_9ACTN|nr:MULTISPECIES: response regulator transcription factor [Parafrankia]MBE3199655.1 response regulator transcription factor [Parafrankia sp. CH37]CUU53676.1 DNA-binding response regulator, NarL/FixJ family, contains REC and HTH domains [Parafrankia irregularis]
MRVTVVDDSVIVREGLRRLLELQGHVVTATLAHPAELDQAVSTGVPDAVILDIRLPPTYTDEGVVLAVALRARRPDLAILLLSQFAVPEYATRLLAAGARGTGYLLKERVLHPDHLSRTLRRLAAGGTVIDPDVVGELVGSVHRVDPLDSLSAREREILGLLAEGLSDRGIAERLVISSNTVSTHVRTVFQKLDLPAGPADNRRVLAVLAYLQLR